jgi:hypothetical protein
MWMSHPAITKGAFRSFSMLCTPYIFVLLRTPYGVLRTGLLVLAERRHQAVGWPSAVPPNRLGLAKGPCKNTILCGLGRLTTAIRVDMGRSDHSPADCANKHANTELLLPEGSITSIEMESWNAQICPQSSGTSAGQLRRTCHSSAKKPVPTPSARPGLHMYGTYSALLHAFLHSLGRMSHFFLLSLFRPILLFLFCSFIFLPPHLASNIDSASFVSIINTQKRIIY